MQENQLNVKMFGGFSVYFNDVPIVTERSRTSKVTQLLSYLLIMRHRPVSQDELIDAILMEMDSNNPGNVLKNLVYRLRKLFQVEGVPDVDIIYYKKGCYGISENLTVNMDAEQFENLSKEMEDETIDLNKKLDLCKEALALYRGDFLPRLSGESWAVVRSVRLQSAYKDLVATAYELLAGQDRLADFLGIARRAITLYGYDEGLHVLHISCLYEMRRYREAMDEYNAVSNMLMDELHVCPSDEMQDLYDKIASRERPFSDSIVEIHQDMSEKERGSGAYYCNFSEFTGTFRFVLRQMERSGQSAYLMLCTISPSNKDITFDAKRLEDIHKNFKAAAEKALRRGDVYTRYSSSQFLLLLMEINMENCNLVVRRIRENFYYGSHGKNINLECKVMSVADMDSVLGGNRLDGRSLRWGINSFTENK